MLEARLHWRHLDGETVLYAASRQGSCRPHRCSSRTSSGLDNRLSLQTDIGVHLPSEESLALRVAGMKSRASASLRYQATRQDQFSLTHWGERYQLQAGTEVGSGRHSALQYTHTYRRTRPRSNGVRSGPPMPTGARTCRACSPSISASSSSSPPIPTNWAATTFCPTISVLRDRAFHQHALRTGTTRAHCAPLPASAAPGTAGWAQAMACAWAWRAACGVPTT